jgi:hypothetical protein
MRALVWSALDGVVVEPSGGDIVREVGGFVEGTRSVVYRTVGKLAMEESLA